MLIQHLDALAASLLSPLAIASLLLSVVTLGSLTRVGTTSSLGLTRLAGR